MTLATLSLAACLTFFGACVAIVHAHAQGRSSLIRSADSSLRSTSTRDACIVGRSLSPSVPTVESE